MKKQFGAVALTAVCILLLFGCSSAPGKEPATLVWYTIGDVEKAADLPLVLEKLNSVLEKRIGARVDIRLIANADYDEKMSVVINSGEPYDICFTSDWANEYAIHARRGKFEALGPYLDSPSSLLWDALDERFWEGAKIDGEIYAIPANKELPYAPVWALTSSLVEKYNMEWNDVVDLEGLEPYLETIYKQEPEIIPLPLRSTDIPGVIDCYDIPADRSIPAYVRYDDASCTVVNPFEQEDVVQHLKTLRRYYEKGYINADAGTNQQKLTNRFAYAGWYSPGAELTWGNQAGYDVVCVPRWGEKYYSTTSTISSMQAISSSSKHKQEAYNFLELLNMDAQIKNMVTYGLEGRHYEKTASNSIGLLDGSLRYSLDYYTLGNYLVQYTVDPAPKDLWDQLKEFNERATPSALFGFKFNYEPVEEEYAAVRRVTEQYLPGLFTGSGGEVEPILQEMNARLEKAGLKKLTDEMQGQINIWRKSGS